MIRILDAAHDSSLDMAQETLAAGGLVVLPTDTVYGIAARLDRPRAVERLFDAKGRPEDLAIPVLVPDIYQARLVGRPSPTAERLADHLWPGGLTLVIPRQPGMKAEIGGDGHTVGLRAPNHPVALALLARTGPLATTSANRSGEETPATAGEIAAVFGEMVGVYLDGGRARSAVPSTVVRVTGPLVEVIRAGVVPVEQILEIAGREGRGETSGRR